MQKAYSLKLAQSSIKKTIQSTVKFRKGKRSEVCSGLFLFEKKKFCNARLAALGKFEFALFDFETVSYLCRQNGTKTHIVYFMNSCFVDQEFIKHYSYSCFQVVFRIHHANKIKSCHTCNAKFSQTQL